MSSSVSTSDIQHEIDMKPQNVQCLRENKKYFKNDKRNGYGRNMQDVDIGRKYIYEKDNQED